MSRPKINVPQRFIVRRRLFCLALLWALLIGWLIIGTGCRPNALPTPPVKDDRPASQKIAALTQQGKWQEAWELADTALVENPNSVRVMASVARVAYETGHRNECAELLSDACRIEGYVSAKRIQQTMIALIDVGRVYEGIDLLRVAVEKNPDQHETRRMLFDFLIGVEQRMEARLHAQVLIRKRMFDVDLLLAMGNTGRRTFDSTPLTKMTEKNDSDLRPLIGLAREQFDEGKLKLAEESSKKILSKHPDDALVYELLCRIYADQGRFDELEQLLKEPPAGVSSHAWYWVSIGQWCDSRKDAIGAARAYWEATKRDVDVATAWTRLSQVLEPLPTSAVTESMLDAIKQRAIGLTQLEQQLRRFDQSGRISRELALEIVQSLDQLGRRWEAEAWASIATTLPEDDAVDVATARAEIVTKLSVGTPWQETTGFEEFAVNLTDFPLPSMTPLATASGHGSSTPRRDTPSPESPAGAPGVYQLMDEAPMRGIRFSGRTSLRDDDDAIIRLHETLGCGGATIDFDLDGWPDLYLAAAGGTPPHQDSQSNAMFRNQHGNFVLVTKDSQSDNLGFSQGCAAGDVNEDGFPDLLILNYGPNMLLINNGDGTFVDRSNWLENNHDFWSTSGAIADLDRDGISDIAIVNYCLGLELLTKNCKTDFTPCSPVVFAAALDQFLFARNDGVLSWQDKTSQRFPTPNVPGRGLGIVVGDFDPKPGNDIYIVNDMTANHFWSPLESKSLDEIRFEESATPRGLAVDGRSQAQGSMGIVVADFDNKGSADFYVTNFEGEYSTLYQQQNPGLWQDVTQQIGLAEPTLPMVAFGAQAIDLDQNGSNEIVVTNGHVAKLSRTGESAQYAQAMQIFEDSGNGVYRLVAMDTDQEYLRTMHVGRSLWTMDANRDGKIDLMVTHKNEPVSLLINHSPSLGAWLNLRLVGTSSSRDAIGAVVVVSANGTKATEKNSQTLFLSSGSGYQCSNEAMLQACLDDSIASADVTVRWPSGKTEKFEQLSLRTHWMLIENSGTGFKLDAPPNAVDFAQDPAP